MNYKKLSIPKRLVSSKDAILAVLEDPELSVPLASKGYPEQELGSGGWALGADGLGRVVR